MTVSDWALLILIVLVAVVAGFMFRLSIIGSRSSALERTRGHWRWAGTIWTIFAVALSLIGAGGALVATAIIAEFNPVAASDLHVLVVVPPVALVLGVAFMALGIVGLFVWLVLALVATSRSSWLAWHHMISSRATSGRVVVVGIAALIVMAETAGQVWTLTHSWLSALVIGGLAAILFILLLWIMLGISHVGK